MPTKPLPTTATNKASVEGLFNQQRASNKNLAGISQAIRINDLSKKQRSQFNRLRSDQIQKLRHRSNFAQTKSYDLIERPIRLDLTHCEAAIKVGDGVLMTGARAGHAWANNSQPKASVSLHDQHRLARPFSLGFQQRQAELVRDLRTLRFRSQPGQDRIHLGHGKEGGLLGLGDQDHPV